MNTNERCEEGDHELSLRYLKTVISNRCLTKKIRPWILDAGMVSC
jgi:hypothetical protein